MQMSVSSTAGDSNTCVTGVCCGFRAQRLWNEAAGHRSEGGERRVGTTGTTTAATT